MKHERILAGFQPQTKPSPLTRLVTKVYQAKWLAPAVLVFLSLVPVLAGAARVTQLASGVAITPDNARFFASPIPVVVHIVGATVYSLVGAFQFSAAVRRKRPNWHRIAGRVVLVCGLAAALSGLWMAHFYPWPAIDGQALYLMRLLFGAGMVLSLLLAYRAVRQFDFDQHRAWMIRAYAIGIGAGTQVFTHLPWLFLGPPDELGRAVSMGAGWVINLLIAEWIIRKGPDYTAVPPGALASSRQGATRMVAVPGVIKHEN